MGPDQQVLLLGRGARKHGGRKKESPRGRGWQGFNERRESPATKSEWDKTVTGWESRCGPTCPATGLPDLGVAGLNEVWQKSNETEWFQ